MPLVNISRKDFIQLIHDATIGLDDQVLYDDLLEYADHARDAAFGDWEVSLACRCPLASVRPMDEIQVLSEAFETFVTRYDETAGEYARSITRIRHPTGILHITD